VRPGLHNLYEMWEGFLTDEDAFADNPVLHPGPVPKTDDYIQGCERTPATKAVPPRLIPVKKVLTPQITPTSAWSTRRHQALVAADGSASGREPPHEAMGIAAGDSAARSGRSCACTAGVRIKDGFTPPSTDPLHQGILPTTRSRIRCGRVVRPIRALISIARVVAASASVSVVGERSPAIKG
jgi:hypothetical protein